MASRRKKARRKGAAPRKKAARKKATRKKKPRTKKKARRKAKPRRRKATPDELEQRFNKLREISERSVNRYQTFAEDSARSFSRGEFDYPSWVADSFEVWRGAIRDLSDAMMLYVPTPRARKTAARRKKPARRKKARARKKPVRRKKGARRGTR